MERVIAALVYGDARRL